MPNVTAHFEAETGDAGFRAALDTLGPRFTVESSTAHRVGRTWLDTDDWLVHKAGMVLEQNESAAGDLRLVLHVTGNRDLVQSMDAIAWPALIGALPWGPIRSVLAPVVGIRALLPTATLRTRRQELQVLNDDRKIVVRLTIESSGSSDGAELADQLTVSPVRGYLDEALRVERRLVTVAGICAAGRSAYEGALAAAARSFGDDAPEPVRMTASMPASEAIIAVLHGFRSTVEHTLDGVLADIDTEFLHDFRVAVRRSRSTLKLTGDVLASDAADRLGSDLKWLGDLTSPTRDLDVHLLGLSDLAAGLQSARPADLDPFRTYLKARRRNEFRRLARALRSARFGQLLDHWRALGLTAEPEASETMVTAGALASDRLSRAYRRVSRRGKAIGPDSEPEALHDLRKRCKELRYLLEIFRPLCDASTHRAALKRLKALQEVLGEFQDSEVQGLAVREFATTMLATSAAPAKTVLAMGELAAQLSAHQRHARAEFAASFAAFDSPRNSRRFRELAGGRR